MSFFLSLSLSDTPQKNKGIQLRFWSAAHCSKQVKLMNKIRTGKLTYQNAVNDQSLELAEDKVMFILNIETCVKEKKKKICACTQMIEHSFTLFKKLSKHALFKVKIHLAWTLYKVKSLVFFSKPTAMNTLERVGI